MTNLEKYDKAFISNLKVTKDQLPGLKYRGLEAWDSVAHMDLILPTLEQALQGRQIQPILV